MWPAAMQYIDDGGGCSPEEGTVHECVCMCMWIFSLNKLNVPFALIV